MKLTLGYLFGMALQTVPEPRKVARDLFDLNLSRGTLWEALALILIGGAIMGVGSSLIFPPAPELSETLIASPLIVAGAEAAIAVLSAFLIFWIGRASGGTGSLEDAIMVVIWLNFVLLIIQLAVLVFSLIAPGLAVILWAVGGVMGFWIMSHFIAEAHGFASAGRVFLAILGVSVVAVVVLSVVLSVLGVGAAITTGELGNV